MMDWLGPDSFCFFNTKSESENSFPFWFHAISPILTGGRIIVKPILSAAQTICHNLVLAPLFKYFNLFIEEMIGKKRTEKKKTKPLFSNEFFSTFSSSMSDWRTFF